MKGLIIKDILLLKSIGKYYLIPLGIFAAIAIATDDMSYMIGFTTVIFAIMPLSLLIMEERCNWTTFALSSTVNRKQSVLSKYLTMIVCSGMALLIYLIISIFYKSDIKEILIIIFGILIYNSLLIPVFLHFGQEKARIFMIVIIMIPSIFGVTTSGVSITIDKIFSIMAIITMIVMIISIYISLKIYDVKDF